MNVGGLFSGIGGLELGLERAGFDIAWHCEADPWCRRLLDDRWPDAPTYPDVRALHGADVEPVDLLCGGFPCQDISLAGKGAGLAGARSGLWSEFARLIRELGPRYVLVENVTALLARGLATVLADLAALGYDAEWDCVPAAAVGAPHRRDRVWVVAYPNGEGQLQPGGPVSEERRRAGDSGQPVADADEVRWNGRARQLGPAGRREPADRRWDVDPWPAEPDVGRVAYGVPGRVDRISALGNAVVPRIPELIGRRILAFEASRMNITDAQEGTA